MNWTPREKLIHCGWTIALLLLAIVALLTLKLGGHADIVALIGVATGLVSLVVGVIAIIYAFYSNSSLSDNASRLEKSSKTIEDAALQTALDIEKIRTELAPLGPVPRL